MAENGIKAMQILDENPDIKVVISDMKMPGMNGIEFIKQAKNNFPHVRYYILTGYAIAADIQDAVDKELIIKYFTKPFKPQEIKSEIAKVIPALASAFLFKLSIILRNYYFPILFFS